MEKFLTSTSFAFILIIIILTFLESVFALYHSKNMIRIPHLDACATGHYK